MKCKIQTNNLKFQTAGKQTNKQHSKSRDNLPRKEKNKKALYFY